MKSIVFITGNLNKVKYTSKFTNYQFEHKKLDLDEIQSLDILKVVEHKVKQAYKIIKAPVLVEDTSLTFHALNGLPGTFIKFFVDNAGNEGMCRMLDSFNDKTATASVCFGLYDGKEFNTFMGITEGKISLKPKGTNGFGWNPIFIPEGFNKTVAQLTDEEFEPINPRKKALMKLEKFLKAV